MDFYFIVFSALVILILELFDMTKPNSRNFETIITELKTILFAICENNIMYTLVKKTSVK